MMRDYGQRLIDCKGCERLVHAMHGYHFTLRPVTQNDREILFQWANDPFIRTVSFEQKTITWHEHCQWLSTVTANQNHFCFIAITTDGQPMGQVRFTLCEGCMDMAIISVCIDRNYRGIGLGSRLIRIACKQVLAKGTVTKVRAQIKRDNIFSLRAFALAGFKQQGPVEICGQQAIAMDYPLEEVGIA
jgi:UDP-2,4-diacetamido-2,4,6-trideoxy-beta-L-altropyranose hydrolase